VTDSTGDQGRDDAPPRSDAPATEPRPLPRHPATELSPGPTHPETELDQARLAGQAGWDPTSTVPGGLRRHGPGVPGPAAERAAPTAEDVWRTGLPSGRTDGRAGGRWRRRAGSALTVALLIAVGVVIYLRLHHG
jgi:hypothetical protein